MLGTDLTLLFSCWLAFLLAILTPGANNLLVSSISLKKGASYGIYCAVGMGLGTLLCTTFVALGMTTLFEAFPSVIKIVGVIGGLIMLRIGYKIFNATPSTQATETSLPEAKSKYVGYGLAVTLSNPKVLIFWLGISSILFQTNKSNAFALLFILLFSLTSFLGYAAFSLVTRFRGNPIFHRLASSKMTYRVVAMYYIVLGISFILYIV